jgi:hypothetical protein
VVSKFDDGLPSSLLIFQTFSFWSKMTGSPKRAAGAADGRQRHRVVFSDSWEYGVYLAVWLVLAAAETRSLGRDR